VLVSEEGRRRRPEDSAEVEVENQRGVASLKAGENNKDDKDMLGQTERYE